MVCYNSLHFGNEVIDENLLNSSNHGSVSGKAEKALKYVKDNRVGGSANPVVL
jgi:hypothetical protein